MSGVTYSVRNLEQHRCLFGRQGHALGSIGRTVILAGGANDDKEDLSLWAYEQTQGWNQIAEDAAFGFGSAVCSAPDRSGDLLVFGGSTLLGECSSGVIRISQDSETEQFRVQRPRVDGLPHARCNMTATTVGDAVVLCGGFDGTEHLGKVEIVRGNAESVHVEALPIPNMKSAARSLHAAAVLDGKLYLIGGEQFAYNGTEFQQPIRLDIEKQVWETFKLADAKAERMARRAGAASVDLGDGRLLLMGGWTHGSEDSKPRLDTGVLDLRSGAWHDAEMSGHTVSERAGLSATRTSDGSIFAFGGWDGGFNFFGDLLELTEHESKEKIDINDYEMVVE